MTYALNGNNWNFEKQLPKNIFTSPVTESQVELEEALQNMLQILLSELSDPGLHWQQKKVLKSAQKNWEGLTVFVDNPHVPMDNNLAERTLTWLNALCGLLPWDVRIITVPTPSGVEGLWQSVCLSCRRRPGMA